VVRIEERETGLGDVPRRRKLATGGALSEDSGTTSIADDRAAAPSMSDRARAYWSSSWPWILLVTGIMLLAAALRFWALRKQGLWFDEIWTVNATMFGPLSAIKTTAHDVNPPLFYALEALSIMLFGTSDGAVRILPAVTGVFATAFMYLAGSKLFNRTTGAWAAALFAVSSIAVEYAQEARMYSQLMLFSALMLWVFALLLEKPTTLKAVALGLVMACSFYTHVFGYLAPPVLLATVLLIPRLRRRVGRQTLIAFAIAGVLFLPWAFIIPAQLEYVHSRAASGGWWMPRPANLGDTLVSNLIAFAPGKKLLPSAIFIGLLVVGVAAFPRSNTTTSENPDEDRVRESDIAYLLGALAFVPMVAGMVIAKYVTPIYTVRNTLVCLPAAYVLVAHGGVKLRKPIGILALLTLLLFGLRSHPQRYAHTYKGTWYQAATLVAAHPEAAVLAETQSFAFNLDTYPKLRGRKGSPNVAFVRDLNASPAKARSTTTGDVTIPAFLSRFNEVYVVSNTKASATATYVDGLPGWKLTATEKMYKPVVRLYTRVK
jgi:mannosyltransferase